MNLRIVTRPALFTALSLSLFAAACGGDDSHDDAVFTGMDAAHLQRTLSVAQMGDLGILIINGAFASGSTQTDCPAITTAGAVTTVTGGCTSDSGARYEGTWTITNVQGIFEENPAYDASKPSSIVARGYTVTRDDGSPVDRIDGSVTFAALATGGGTIDGDVDVTLEGIGSHSALSYDCVGEDDCTVAGGSWFSVDGVGAAAVSGSFKNEAPRAGAITAKGASTLVIDVANSTDDCTKYSIDGAQAELCDDDGEARLAQPTLQVDGLRGRIVLPVR